jgi:ferredoxin
VAVAAGLGIMGRHRCVIHPKFGDYILLGTVLLAAEASDYDRPLADSPCLECKLCVTACPTGAISAVRRSDGTGPQWPRVNPLPPERNPCRWGTSRRGTSLEGWETAGSEGNESQRITLATERQSSIEEDRAVQKSTGFLAAHESIASGTPPK